jgi:quercetin dioxygenase-like cupin family protein
MNVKPLLEDLEFHDPMPYAQPLLVDRHSRILRWMLQPGQVIDPHNVPDSPFYVVLIQGRGLFCGSDGEAQEIAAPALITFNPGETHAVSALDEPLVFVSFLDAVEGMRPTRIGGTIASE